MKQPHNICNLTIVTLTDPRWIHRVNIWNNVSKPKKLDIPTATWHHALDLFSLSVLVFQANYEEKNRKTKSRRMRRPWCQNSFSGWCKLSLLRIFIIVCLLIDFAFKSSIGLCVVAASNCALNKENVISLSINRLHDSIDVDCRPECFADNSKRESLF